MVTAGQQGGEITGSEDHPGRMVAVFLLARDTCVGPQGMLGSVKERVRDVLNCRFQCPGPLLAVSGVHVGCGMAEQIPLTSTLTAGCPSGVRVLRTQEIAVWRCDSNDFFPVILPVGRTTLRNQLDIRLPAGPFRRP